MLFMLPLLLTFILMVVAMIVIATDDKVYAINLRIEEFMPVAITGIVASGLLAFLLYLMM